MNASNSSTRPRRYQSETNAHKADRGHRVSPNLGECCLGGGLALALRLLSSTWKIQCEGLEIFDQLVRSQPRHILAFWHRHYIALYRVFRQQPTIAITNQSHRGQVIARICHCSGMRTLQVAGKGTKRMLDSLSHEADGGVGLGIAVDGPLGPACEVKQAVIHLASRLQCPIVPVAVASGFKHVFAKRWDRLEVPYLFSRVAVVIGEPIVVPPTGSRTLRRELGRQLKNSIDQGTVLARQRLEPNS